MVVAVIDGLSVKPGPDGFVGGSPDDRPAADRARCRKCWHAMCNARGRISIPGRVLASTRIGVRRWSDTGRRRRRLRGRRRPASARLATGSGLGRGGVGRPSVDSRSLIVTPVSGRPASITVTRRARAVMLGRHKSVNPSGAHTAGAVPGAHRVARLAFAGIDQRFDTRLRHGARGAHGDGTSCRAARRTRRTSAGTSRTPRRRGVAHRGHGRFRPTSGSG